ncbi:MAG: T9SS type A sorting domain-containing protein [Bacteroidetes bacterium]|nr:T9SS type A sorting domain-containing protein [Bacteroidota bacterium]
MRYALTLAAALASILAVQAQPTLTLATNAPVAGTDYTIEHGPYVSPGNAGALQSWDLSGLTSDSTAALQLVLPSATTNGAQFPIATVAEVSAPVTSYYQVSADGIRFAGSDDGTSLIVNTPAPTYLAFPCSMGTTWSTPYAATFNYDGNDVFRSGTVTGEADGYGTVTMPWGPVQDVLRIHLMNVLQDSMELFTLEYTLDSYLFYRAGQSYPLVQLVTATIDMGFGQPQVEQFSRWADEISTGMAAPSVADQDLLLYPNPTSGEVDMRMPAGAGANATASILDAAGRVVHQERVPVSGGSTARLDLHDLAPGLYTVQLTDGQGACATARLSRQ